MEDAPRKDLSIVIPFYNEEECIIDLLNEIKEVMEKLPLNYEVIAIDDGSSDTTVEKLYGMLDNFPQLQVISLVRNYGQTAAISAGFHQSQGALVMPMDGDGQNDPHDIPKYLEAMTEDVDMVSGWRKNRSETEIRRTLPSKIANNIIRKLSKIEINDTGCTMKLYRYKHIKDVELYGEMHRFIPVYVLDVGGKIKEIEVNHRPRSGGQSKYGLERTFKVLMDLSLLSFFVSVRDRPIYLFGGIGFIEFILGSLIFLAAVVLKVMAVMRIDINAYFGMPITPLPTLPNMGLFLMSMGVLTVLMGLLADLMMRTYYESQGKKPYRIKNIRTKDFQ